MQHNHILVFIDMTEVMINGEDFPDVRVLQLNQYPSREDAFKDYLDNWLTNDSWSHEELLPSGLFEYIEEYVQVDLLDLEQPYQSAQDIKEELKNYVSSGRYISPYLND